MVARGHKRASAERGEGRGVGSNGEQIVRLVSEAGGRGRE